MSGWESHLGHPFDRHRFGAPRSVLGFGLRSVASRLFVLCFQSANSPRIN